MNQASYYPLGKFHYEKTLAFMVKKAWASALGLSTEETERLVEIPDNPVYTVNRNPPPARFHNLAIRLAYFAWDNNKILGGGRRNFGYSNSQCRNKPTVR
ncbi:inovirus-type Gp2 protein [Vibrio crassostreae]|nr:inovirus-type Gp2 protein [Vibrio crassostreae]